MSLTSQSVLSSISILQAEILKLKEHKNTFLTFQDQLSVIELINDFDSKIKEIESVIKFLSSQIKI